MDVIIVEDCDEMSERAADIVIRALRERPDLVLGLATGTTPEGLYRRLVEAHKKDGVDFFYQPQRKRKVILPEAFQTMVHCSHVIRYFLDVLERQSGNILVFKKQKFRKGRLRSLNLG